ncbi:MAG: hypothetical protein JWN40_1046 [Phycisphaerales bacterium]|nr:hypothetical protein [Phycisphaerales bacterium]
MCGVQRVAMVPVMQMRPVQVLAMQHVKVQPMQVSQVVKCVQVVLVMHVSRR